MQKSRLLWAITVSFLCLTAMTAQSIPDSPSRSDRKNSTETGKRSTEDKILDLVVPDTMIVEGRETRIPPLSVGQKFGQVEKNFFDPFTFAGLAIESGVDQASDIHHRYGQGAQGYGKRYGANLADTATAQFFGFGVYPSIMHTDPRYYRAGHGGVIRRGWYAATRVFVTRTDSGRNIFNAPEILASATSSGISVTYYPSDERTAGDFAYSMGSRIAFDAVYNLAKEFWPDVRYHLFGHR